MGDSPGKKRSKGGYFLKQISNAEEISFKDFENPWTFHGLFMQSSSIWIQWLISQGVLANQEQIWCQHITNQKMQFICASRCTLQKRSNKIDGYTWRCKENSAHETSVRHASFFAKSKHTIPDTMQFIKCYLDGMTMKKCAAFSNIAYNSTAVTWSSYLRDVFMQYVWDSVIQSEMKLGGCNVVEVDESHFGKKCKYHRGNIKSSIDVWIVGLAERTTGKQIMYPVDKRDSETLLKIIKRHVEPGSTIFTDGWQGYRGLNDAGYNHFSVIHKDSFVKTYQNPSSGEKIVVHTNTVEGGWQVPKDHFKIKHGVQMSTIEGHLAEIMWRNHHKGSPGQVYESFFMLLNHVYNHYYHWPRLTAPRPLFDTWQADMEPDDVIRVHAMFDDKPVVPLTATEIQEIVSSDHDYVPPTSDAKPASSSEDKTQPDEAVEERTNHSKSDDPPSTSTMLLYSEEQPDDEDSYPVPGQKDPVLSSPLRADQGSPPAPVRGYKNIFFPPGWEPVPETSSSDEEQLPVPQPSSSEDDFKKKPPKKMRRRRKPSTKAKCCRNLHELYPMSSDSDFC